MEIFFNILTVLLIINFVTQVLLVLGKSPRTLLSWKAMMVVGIIYSCVALYIALKSYYEGAIIVGSYSLNLFIISMSMLVRFDYELYKGDK